MAEAGCFELELATEMRRTGLEDRSTDELESLTGMKATRLKDDGIGECEQVAKEFAA
jgi:hypothetical protein